MELHNQGKKKKKNEKKRRARFLAARDKSVHEYFYMDDSRNQIVMIFWISLVTRKQF